MKKHLLTIISAGISALALAQTTSPFWSIIQNPMWPVVSGGVRYMDAVNQNVVWCTGYDGFAPGLAYNFFARTIDGGNTWNNGNVFADTNTYIISNIEGVNDTIAWVSAYMKASQDRGVLYYTKDGGNTWQQGSDSTMFQVAGQSFANVVCFLTPSVGIAMGDPITSNGGKHEIYLTNDAGATWTMVPGSNIPAPLSGEYGLTNSYTKVDGDAKHMWFGTNKRRVFYTKNAGQTWSVSVLTGAPTNLYVTDLAFTDTLNGLALGYLVSGSTVNYYLFKTTNGGVSWTQITPLDPNLGKNDICAIPGTTWFASVGAGTGNQVISYSTNHGTTWNSWGGSNVQYLAIDFVDNQNGWAGGFEDQVMTNGGIYKYSGSPLGFNTVTAIPKNLDVYPNPSKGEINIKLPLAKKGMTLQIINTIGQIVYEENITNLYPAANHQLHLNVPAGIYVIKMNVDNEVFISKINIQ
ncbi:MAG: T9SS type A sorting domain-containing protein [Bacteroidia bacterium]|nr:T9SS type A sorting domain-containing protein [Bacteroidia bacterium]